MSAALTLYATPLSANGRKVLALCRHLGIAPRIETVDVYRGEGQTPEYLAIHPLGRIPALVDGDLVLWESNAILQYLSEQHGDGRLWSREPRRRAEIAAWLFWESCDWQPALAAILAPFVAPLVVPQPSGAQAAPADVDWGDARFRRTGGFLDAQLAGRTFLAGEELTLADFSVAGMMTYARRARFPFDAYANIARWYEGIEQLDAWQATAADLWRA